MHLHISPTVSGAESRVGHKLTADILEAWRAGATGKG
jgi:hypothetical protein